MNSARAFVSVMHSFAVQGPSLAAYLARLVNSLVNGMDSLAGLFSFNISWLLSILAVLNATLARRVGG